MKRTALTVPAAVAALLAVSAAAPPSAEAQQPTDWRVYCESETYGSTWIRMAEPTGPQDLHHLIDLCHNFLDGRVTEITFIR
jgi:hypothetical protein